MRAQPEAISMRRAGWGLLAAVTLGGCSGDGPHLTNPAVEACTNKADDLGYEGIGERETRPAADGRYTIILDVREQQGYTQVTCAYDPKKGAEIDDKEKDKAKAAAEAKAKEDADQAKKNAEKQPESDAGKPVGPAGP